MNDLIAPEDCETMNVLRTQIDALDEELVRLLHIRSHYIDRAVDLKKVEGLPARITDRVVEVLDKVAHTAEGKGLDPQLARKLWTELIEWSIARESKELDA